MRLFDFWTRRTTLMDCVICNRGTFCVLAFMLISQCQVDCSYGEDFGDLLTRLSDEALGVQKMQDYVDKEVKDKVSNLSGGGLIKEISRDLRDKFKTAIDVVRKLKQHYEQKYTSLQTEAIYYECCKPPDSIKFQYDIGLKREVNSDSLCFIGVGVKDANTKHFDQSFIDLMKDNLENYDKQHIIKWQYFGTEEGVLHIYPGSSGCPEGRSDRYDPRFRPWYVETATPKPKDVVIVIDNSLSMNDIPDSRTLMHIAIEAAKTVVESLNPNDKVGVLAFSDIAEVPTAPGVPGCYRDSLAQATPVNKANIKQLIDTIHAAGGTKYIAALEKAFQLLSSSINSTDRDERDATILFLTDGRSHESHVDILNTIRDHNGKLGNQVIILTFGIGEVIHQDIKTIQLLKDMAEQKGANTSYGKIRKGRFTAVQNPNNLRRVMGTYYEFFNQASEDIVIATPYFDGFGLGLITSICIPVRTNSSFRGIACVDISLSQLLGAAAYFRPSEKSYAFIVDNYGRLMTHPMLQKLYEYSHEPLFVDMLEIEKTSDANNIKKSMLSGESGEKAFISKRIISRGDSIHYGVDSRGVKSEYFWEQIQYTNYSVCVVIGIKDVRIQYIEYKPLTSFLYQRLDLVTPPGACNNFGQLAVKESTVKFTTGAFVRPGIYFDTPENKDTAQRYRDMMLGKTPYDATFRDGVKEMVAVTQKADEIWRSPEVLDKTSNFSIWKYIGTENGVFRIFPGTPLYTEYDQTARPWYKRAMSNKGRHSLSTPYEDAGGAGEILTLSKTIFQKGESPHKSGDPVLGVMGLDFSVPRFYSMIVERFPVCMKKDTTCFVMDNAGYLVFHRDFIPSGNVNPNVKSVHIIEKEPSIAYNLIDKGFMKKEACVKFSTVRNQYFWRVELEIAKPVIVSTRYLNYELHVIDKSNVFFGLKTWDTNQHNGSCTCTPETPRGEEFINCKNTGQRTCECPCSSATPYEYCDNTFHRNGDGWPTCTPDPAPVKNTQTLGNDIAANLSVCFDFKCHKITSVSDCRNVVGCVWCHRDSLGRLLHDSFCTLYKNCPRGIEKQESKDGQWSTWGEWEISECNNRCGNGTARGKRYRTCDNPPKRFRGKDCTGDDFTTSDILPCVGDCTGLPGFVIPVVVCVVIVVLVLVAVIVGLLCWRKRRNPRSTHKSMMKPFRVAYENSIDNASSPDQSSGSGTSGSVLIHSDSATHINPDISFAQPQNPLYESGDGIIGQKDDFLSESTTNMAPVLPARPLGALRSNHQPGHFQGMYISPRSPIPVSQ